ncbi:butyrophilin-like protein 3, partial [Silurus asotus]
LQVVGPAEPLVVVAGEDLILPCFIKLNTSVVDMTVEWFKLDINNPLVHLYKDHEDRNEDQALPYRERTSLFKEELQNGNASLKLSALRVSDEGEYKCFIQDKSQSDDITVNVIVEAQGSQPVIMMENYDNSGGIHLVCESKGWNPDPKILWLNREGDTLPAEDTQIHRDTEGFSVKSSITVHDYSDSNRFYCRVLQIHHMMETEIIINNKVFDVWKWIVGTSISSCLIAVGSIITVVIFYKKGSNKRPEKLNVHIRNSRRNNLQLIRSTGNMVGYKKSLSVWQCLSEVKMGRGSPIPPMLQRKILEQYQKGISQRKIAKMDVTLDPDSAHPNLILSPDGKQVRCGDTEQNLTDTPQRFTEDRAVVGNQSFSSGRFYYEVQVRGKIHWILGVVRENINRKEWIIASPQDGFWTVRLCNNQYYARADTDVLLTVREKVEKLGVFVDYDEGLVSFYDVNSRSHIYSFTGQTFTHKLIPYFSTWYNDGAPLI